MTEPLEPQHRPQDEPQTPPHPGTPGSSGPGATGSSGWGAPGSSGAGAPGGHSSGGGYSPGPYPPDAHWSHPNAIPQASEPYGSPPITTDPYATGADPSGGYPPPPGWPDQPHPARHRFPTWIWALVAIVVIVGGVLVGLVAVNGGDKKSSDAAGTEGRSLSLPSAVRGYQQITSVDTQQLIQQFRGQLAGLGDEKLIEKAMIGLYSQQSDPQFVFLGLAVTDMPQLQKQVDDHGVGTAVKQFVSGITSGIGTAGGSVTTKPASVDPGALGGSMQCGEIQLLTRSVGLCAWGDRSAFALNLVLDPANQQTTAELVREFRSAAEH